MDAPVRPQVLVAVRAHLEQVVHAGHEGRAREGRAEQGDVAVLRGLLRERLDVVQLFVALVHGVGVLRHAQGALLATRSHAPLPGHVLVEVEVGEDEAREVRGPDHAREDNDQGLLELVEGGFLGLLPVGHEEDDVEQREVGIYEVEGRQLRDEFVRVDRVGHPVLRIRQLHGDDLVPLLEQ